MKQNTQEYRDGGALPEHNSRGFLFALTPYRKKPDFSSLFIILRATCVLHSEKNGVFVKFMEHSRCHHPVAPGNPCKFKRSGDKPNPNRSHLHCSYIYIYAPVDSTGVKYKSSRVKVSGVGVWCVSWCVGPGLRTHHLCQRIPRILSGRHTDLVNTITPIPKIINPTHRSFDPHPGDYSILLDIGGLGALFQRGSLAFLIRLGNGFQPRPSTSVLYHLKTGRCRHRVRPRGASKIIE